MSYPTTLSPSRSDFPSSKGKTPPKYAQIEREELAVPMVDWVDPASPRPTAERVYTDSKVYQYISQVFIKNGSQDWKRSPFPLVLKTILSLGGIAGRIPYYPLSMKAGGGNTALGMFYMVANTTTFGAQYVWSAIRMVNKTVVSLKSAEKVGQDQFSLCTRIATLSGVILFGSAAQIPSICVSLFYNKANPAMVLLNLMDVIFPIFSFDMLVKDKIQPYFLENREKGVFKLKNELVNRLNRNRLNYFTDSAFREELERFFLALSASTESEQAKLERVFTQLTKEAEFEALPKASRGLCNQSMRMTAIAIGLLLTLTLLFWTGLFTYQGSMEHISGEAVAWTFVAITVISNSMLLRTLVVLTTLQAIRSSASLLSGKSEITYVTEPLYPHLSVAAKVVCLALSILTFPVGTQVSYDYLPEPFQIPSAVLLSMAYIITAYLPMRDLSDWMIQEVAKQRGTAQEQQIIRRSQQFLDFAEYLESCSPKSVAKFLLSLGQENEVNGLLAQFAISRESLVDLTA